MTPFCLRVPGRASQNQARLRVAEQSQSQGLLKIALDELRMQMLGTQVLFGFQFQALFQERFPFHSRLDRLASAAGFTFIVTTCALLITAPSIHRLALQGDEPHAMCRYTKRLASTALATLALVLTADVFLVTHSHLGTSISTLCAAATVIACAVAWYGVSMIWAPQRSSRKSRSMAPERSTTPLHTKIDYMLTEARVILPGAQALLGFQFIVTMTRRFGNLPFHWQCIHFLSLGLVTAAILILIAPAAIHRQAFMGDDDLRFLKIGSAIVTFALLPLAFGMAADLSVSTFVLSGSEPVAGGAAGIALLVLLTLWYAVPMYLRNHR